MKPSSRITQIMIDNKWPINTEFQLLALITYLDEQQAQNLKGEE